MAAFLIFADNGRVHAEIYMLIFVVTLENKREYFMTYQYDYVVRHCPLSGFLWTQHFEILSVIACADSCRAGLLETGSK